MYEKIEGVENIYILPKGVETKRRIVIDLEEAALRTQFTTFPETAYAIFDIDRAKKIRDELSKAIEYFENNYND